MKQLAGAIVLVLVMVIALHQFLNEYSIFTQNSHRVTIIESRIRTARKEQGEMTQKMISLEVLRSFMKKAELLGLEEKDWSSYDVSLNDSYIFEDLKRILNQCANSDDYLFRPVSLHITVKTPSDDTAMPSHQRKKTEREAVKKDAVMVLKGAFFAKRP